jgi:hypothetical protein
MGEVGKTREGAMFLIHTRLQPGVKLAHEWETVLTVSRRTTTSLRLDAFIMSTHSYSRIWLHRICSEL